MLPQKSQKEANKRCRPAVDVGVCGAAIAVNNFGYQLPSAGGSSSKKQNIFRRPERDSFLSESLS